MQEKLNKKERFDVYTEMLSLLENKNACCYCEILINFLTCTDKMVIINDLYELSEYKPKEIPELQNRLWYGTDEIGINKRIDNLKQLLKNKQHGNN
jgi:hypothetical protein